MKPVLILGEEPRIVVNIARSLHRRGVPVDVAALSADAQPLRSNAIRRFITLPDPRGDPAFSRAILLDHIESDHYDHLIPASDTALGLVADHYAQLTDLLHVTCPPPEVIHRVLNKSQTLQCAQDCQVPIPKSMAISSLKELAERGPSLGFPVIAKPCGKGHRTTGTFKVRRFETIEQLEQAFTEEPTFGIQNLIQEYCPGEGIGIEVLMHGDQPLVLFQHRRLKELPSTGGVSVLAVAEPVDALLGDYAVRLLRAMKWNGVAMVEFRVDKPNGQVSLMEVNGRYWGSLRLSILAGVDFPWYEWQIAHGQSPDITSHYRSGVSGRWTSGAIQRISSSRRSEPQCSTLWSLCREIVGFAHDCLPPTRDLLWSIRDPRPGLHETMAALHAMAHGALKQILMPIVPERLVSIRRQSRVLGARARRMYLWMAMRRALKLTRDRLPECLHRSQSVLFVCYGNIIRSPMAAELMRRALVRIGRHDVRVESAGLYAKPMRGADPRSIAVARESGVSLEGHESTPISRDLVLRSDLILVMDYLNEAELLCRYPEAGRKVFLLGACQLSPEVHWHRAEIDDPYQGSHENIRDCYDRLDACINALAGHWQVPAGSPEEQTLHAQTAAFSNLP